MNSNEPIRAVVFDLDGTLLDTLADIRDAVNDSLASFGFPPRSTDEIRRFVGNGAVKLLERALPCTVPQETFAALYRMYDARYSAHREDKTKPYPGAEALLRELRAQGFLTAVLSNKQDNVTRPLCARYFPGLLDLATGPADGRRTKPSPDGLEYIAHTFGIQTTQMVYVGDSETDILTGRQANLPTISVCWGFRSRETLVRNGAEYVAQKMEEIPIYLAQIIDKRT